MNKILTFLVASITFTAIVPAISCKKDEPENVSQIIVSEDAPVTDYDGNTYKTVKIGNQIWMAENLRVTHYRNGDPIANVTENSQWAGFRAGAYCTYNNDNNADFVKNYGFLYNCYSANDTRGIAPIGWHIPTTSEWLVLIDYLGGENSAGGKMKETGTIHWNAPNTGATNQSGFTALSSGIRDGNSESGNGTFFNKGNGSYHWIASSNVRFVYLSFDTAVADSRTDEYKQDGFSIRCIKD